MNGGLIYGDEAWRVIDLSAHASWDNPERVTNEVPGLIADVDSPSSLVVYNITLDFQATETFTGWALVNHNMPSAGGSVTAYLMVGTADTGSTFETQVDIITHANAPEPSVCGTFSSVTKRYWRMHYYPVSCDYLQLGVLVLGTWHEFATAPAAPYEHDATDQVQTAWTVSAGRRRRASGEPFQEFSLRWPLASATARDDLAEIVKLHGGAEHPLVYVPLDASGSNPYECHYVVVDGFTVRQLSMADRYDIRLDLREVL